MGVRLLLILHAHRRNWGGNRDDLELSRIWTVTLATFKAQTKWASCRKIAITAATGNNGYLQVRRTTPMQPLRDNSECSDDRCWSKLEGSKMKSDVSVWYLFGYHEL